MKAYLSLITLSLFALGFSSCCKFSSGACAQTLTKTVTEVKETTHTSAKGGSYVTTEVVSNDMEVPVTCAKCNTSFKPCTTCCGGVSDVVTERASVQGWNGNPFIGLIPTMKVLAE